jgi:hypothetical protein
MKFERLTLIFSIKKRILKHKQSPSSMEVLDKGAGNIESKIDLAESQLDIRYCLKGEHD